MNSVNLIGRVCQDIELVGVGKGKESSVYTRFSLAVPDGRDKEGEPVTQFVPCIAWNNIANIMHDYTLKGDRIGVEGRLNIQNYEKDGEQRKSIQIVVQKVHLLEPKKESSTEEPKNFKRKR